MTLRLWLLSWKDFLRDGLRPRRRIPDYRIDHLSCSQTLERRLLLSGTDCLGQIEGVSFHDLNDNGVFNAGEALSNAVDGVVVHLFDAGANGTFESAGNSGVAVGDDVFIQTALPDANGFYQFSGLGAATYFVEQPTPSGFIQRSGESVSPAIVITATDAQGTPGTLIDGFDAPATPQVATANSGSPTGFSSAVVTALGGERDLQAIHSSGGLNVELSANAVAGTLALSSGTGTAGSGVASWDGLDGAAALDTSGLGGVDLTDSGASEGLLISRNGDAVGSLTVTIHTDATTSSAITASIPVVAETIYLPFSSFTPAVNGADFTNVNAIELLMSGPAGFDGELNLFQAYGPTTFTANFSSFAPLTLGGTVFQDDDNSGSRNGLEAGINGVTLTLFEDTNSSGQFEAGQDNVVTDAGSSATTSGGGHFAFSNLFPGDYLVQIDASNFAGGLTNFVSSTGNDPTPDPDNNIDDDDNGGDVAGTIVSAAISLAIEDEPTNDGDSDDNTNLTLDFGVLELVDIVVTKSDNADPVTAGSAAGNLVYTLGASNIGPSDATGVQVTDALITSLPTGWTLVSAVGTGSTSFNSVNGIWSVGDLDSGSSVALTITISVGSDAVAGTTTNTAIVSAVNETEVSAANNTAVETTTVERQVDIAVSISENADPVTAGSGSGNLVHTVTVANNGPSDASGVQVTDLFVTSLPTAWTLDSGLGTGGSTFQPSTGLWNIGVLESGQSRILSLTFTVGSSAAATTVTNTVNVTAVTEPESSTTNNEATEDTTVARLVDIQVFKSDNADPVTAGSAAENLIYSVTVTNNGPSDASGVQVTDALVTALPAGWSLAGTSGTGSTNFNATSGIWTIGDLPDGDSETLTLTITVDNSASPGTITNTAVVTGVTESESTTGNNSTSETTMVQRRVDIEVTKSDNVDPLTAGSGVGNLTYTIEARNNGPSNATGVEVTDAIVAALPVGWSLVSGTGSGVTTFDTDSGVWTIGDLPDGVTQTLELVLTVGGAAADGTTTNTVVVTGVNETETTTANNTATEDTTIARVVDIEVTKTDNVDPVIAGSGPGNLVYTVTATNNGPSDATSVEVQDAFMTALPDGWSFVSAVGEGGTTFNEITGIWAAGNIATGTSKSLTLTLTVGSSAIEETITNTAIVVGVDQVESTTANNVVNETTEVQRVVDIVLTKTDNVDPVIAGSGAGNLVYTVTATNDGPSDATGVAVNDAFLNSLPTGWSLIGGTGSGVTMFDPSTNVWNIGDLAAGSTETLTLTLTVDDTAASGLFTNVVTVFGTNETDSSLINNTATEDTLVGRSVDIALTRSDNVDPVTAGSGTGNLTFQMTATNNGPSNATDLLVTDTLIASLPAGWQFVSASPSAGTTFNSSLGIWDIGQLNQGITETLSITVTVGAGASEGVQSGSVEVTRVNEIDRDPDNDTATEDTTVQRRVDVRIEKTDVGDPVTAGSGTGNLTYTLTAFNDGVSDASDVQLTDALLASLPTGWSFESASAPTGTGFNPSSGVWTIDTLPSGTGISLGVVLTIGSAAFSGTTTNVVTLSAVNETDTNASNNSSTEDTLVQRIVDVRLAKADSVDPVASGNGSGNLEYTITATNDGPSDASGVAVTDLLLASLPVGWTLDAGSPDSGTVFTASSGIWTIGDLPVGSVRTLTLTMTVDGSAAVGATVNTASVTSLNETDADLSNNTAEETTTVLRTVDIVVSQSGVSGPITAGSGTGNLSYTITARNDGPSNATNVRLTDSLPAALPTGWSIDSATGSNSSTFDASTGVWDVGTLNVGQSVSLTVSLTVGAAAAAGLTATTVSLSSLDQADGDLANNSVSRETQVTRSVNIGVTKTGNATTVFAGAGSGNLIYTVTAFNTGPSDAGDVQISDAMLTALPTGFSLNAAVGSHGTTFSALTGIWDVGQLPAGAFRNLTITITVDDSATDTSVTNVAAVTRVNELDSDSANDSASETTQILRAVNIGLTRSDAGDPVVAGSGPGNLVYTLTAENTGQADATGLTISDALLTSLPSGVSIVSVTGTDGSTFNSANGIWTIGNLSSGDSRQLTVVLTVGHLATVSSLTSTVIVANVDQHDSDQTNNTITESTTIVREVDLVVVKNDDADPLRSPGILTYTIDVSNAGQSAAADVVLTDVLSTQVTFLDALVTQGTVSENGGVVTANLGSLLPDARATVTVRVQIDIPLGGRIENAVSVTSSGTDTNPSDNTDSESTVIEPQLFSVAGTVFQDLNGNGVQDAGEQPVPGAQVGIFGQDGHGNDVLLTMETDASGGYSFEGLLQGQYHLFEVQPLIYEDGVETPGTGAGTTSVGDDAFFALDLNSANGSNAVGFNFAEGTIDESKRELLASNIDVTPPAPVDSAESGSLSGRVVIDENNNGIYDAADSPVFAASVTLAGRRSNGQPVLVTARTNTNGEYIFSGLPEGTYHLVEQQPYGLNDGPEQSGNLMAGHVLDDVFSDMMLLRGANGSGFNFLERRPSETAAGSLTPIVLANGIETSAQPTLAWTPVAGITTYDVWISQISDSAGVVYRNEAVSGTSLSVPVALSLGLHRMWVRAVDGPLNGPWSLPVTFRVSPESRVLSPVGNTVESSPTISWESVRGAAAYDVVVQDARGLELARITDVTETSVVVPVALEEGRHTVWVRAKNVDVTGHWSQGADFVVTGAPVTLGPTLASVFAAPLMEWTDTGASSYRIWVNDITSSSVKVLETIVSGTSYSLSTGLQEGHRYRYWVQAVDGNAASDWSEPRTFTLDATSVITSPEGIISTNMPTITWTEFAGATHYDLWVSDSSGLYLRNQAVTSASFTFTTVLPDGDYQVWVQPETAGQSARWSSPVSFTVGALTQPVLTPNQSPTSNRRPVFSWTDDPLSVSTEIWVNHVGVTNRVIHEREVTGDSFTPTFDLAPGTYDVWVRSRGITGVRSAWSVVMRLDVV